jgi:HEAT repeat protein
MDLLTKLHDADESARRTAVEGLGELRDKQAVKPLIELLVGEKNAGVMEAAGNALVMIGGDETARQLLPLLNSEEAKIRNLACEILTGIGRDAVPCLIALLSESADGDIRKFVVDVLGDIGDPSAVPVLTRALTDENVNVGCSAAESLGKVGDGAAATALIDVIKSGNLDIGYYAVVALGKIKSPASVDFLESLLFDDNQLLLKYPAIDALGEIGDKRALGSLRKLLTLEDPMAQKNAMKAIGRIGIKWLEETFAAPRDEKLKECVLASLVDDDKDLKRFALIALGSLREIAGVEMLVELLEKDDDLTPFIIQTFVRMGKIDPSFLTPLLSSEKVREIMPKVLGDIQNKATLGILTGLAGDSSSKVRCAALLALGKLGAVEEMPRLLQALKDEDSEVRTVAATALGWLKDAHAADALMQLLGDPSRKVAEAAANAMVMIGTDLLGPLLDAVRNDRIQAREEIVRAFGIFEPQEKIKEVLLALLKDGKSEIRRAAVMALGAYNTETLFPQIGELVRDADPRTRAAAVKVLSQVKNDQVMDILLAAADDSDPWVRYEVIHALEKFNSDRIVNTFMSALIQGENIVQIAACEVLGNLRYEKAKAPITGLLKSEDQDVRQAAVKALKRINGTMA